MNKAISPGTYLPSEQFPIFKLIPEQWNPARARAEESFRFSTDLWTQALKRVEARRAQGDKRTSLTDEMLDDFAALDQDVFGGSKLPNFLGALFQGAADTGALAINAHIMFLATHPWVQDKAQKELDAVCVDRMPTWTDFQDLPYINCIMKEGLRIRPV